MIYLKDLLSILFKNQFIFVFDEFDNLLYNGYVWGLDNKYMLSCPVVALKKDITIKIYISYF